MLKLTKLFYIVPLAGLLLLTACSKEFRVQGGTANLGQLESVRAVGNVKGHIEGVTGLRIRAIREAGVSIGARSALAWRTRQINRVINLHGNKLDQIFNFRGMLVEKHVLPPVMSEARDVLNVDNDQTIRLADRTYTIIKQARFSAGVPSWHEYLEMNFKAPEMPHDILLPRTGPEIAAWQESVRQGWTRGVLQANMIYEENLARLKRDYVGMALYKKLLSLRMVSKPYVAKASLGVTGGGDHMRIGDKVLRITALPELSTHTQYWNAVVEDQRDNP